MIAVLDRYATPLRYKLEEHVSLLREPGRHVCCQLPKALVLYGLKGIGKTHIAKTIAREANCRSSKWSRCPRIFCYIRHQAVK
ncbi:hypothetical protein niasHT_038243 [Heterodera trifolii]|uniref:ATPase AAA-type core domain-containing protein n=1 Tax=Heterodera trifolii TaxID=157864 RepID=A0ABD2I7S9_9BILA